MQVGDLVKHWRYEFVGVITDERQIGDEANFKVHWNTQGTGWYSPDRLVRVR